MIRFWHHHRLTLQQNNSHIFHLLKHSHQCIMHIINITAKYNYNYNHFTALSLIHSSETTNHESIWLTYGSFTCQPIFYNLSNMLTHNSIDYTQLIKQNETSVSLMQQDNRFAHYFGVWSYFRVFSYYRCKIWHILARQPQFPTEATKFRVYLA